MEDGFLCPSPIPDNHGVISLAHGEGGGLTRRFIREHIHSVLSNAILDPLGDAALVSTEGRTIAFTTDSYVVTPLFFPGGDIGSLAVYGTVNDLLVSGAEPRFLSLCFVIEEGLPLEVFDRLIRSIKDAADDCGVRVVTGDTKVVARGECDQIFINTTGIGMARETLPAGPEAIRPGDQIIVTGPIARHGIAILACRHLLDLTPQPLSDSRGLFAELNALVPFLPRIRAMRDATRGGVGAVLQEWAEASGCTLTFDSRQLPINKEVQAVCELLGLDPMHIACEGTMAFVAEPEFAVPILAELQRAGCDGARVIGRARERDIVPVTSVSVLGQELPFEEPLGAPLPRIC